MSYIHVHPDITRNGIFPERDGIGQEREREREELKDET
jgi:hypothetical protein